MDYLRNLGSAAVSSLVQKSGLTLPFSLGQRVASFDNKSIWTLYDATKREDGSPVSVFEFDSSLPRNRNCMPLARNALRKLRTIRHPDVVKFLDAVETDSTISIMTERVRPLVSAIQERVSKPAQEREDWILWGLHRIAVALSFVNDTCASTHGNIRIDSVFISASGEWKLGGFEVLSNPQDNAAILYTMGGITSDATTYASPEVKKGGWSALKEYPTAVTDAYALGLLIHFSFNTSQPLPATAQPPHPPPSPQSRGSIPVSVFASFKRLLNPNPKARLTPTNFLELGMAHTANEGSGFFASNKLVKLCAGLDNLNLGSESEKASLLRTLKDSAASLPTEFASYRVLPALASALEFGGASAAAILPLVLQLGKNVPLQDYSSVIMVHLVKLFSSPDRGTRMALLSHLPEYSDKLDKKTVVDKIWPSLQTGFTDTVPVIREATVKAIILLANKLNERILNNDLLRHLARMQADPEASIRTNTCILLGRLGPMLGYNTKRKVLVPAFTKALKDSFVHCRVAGLMALMATADCFDVGEIASRVIPNMSFAMVDPEKLVRDQAFKAIQLFVKKLEEHAATMAETSIVDDPTTGVAGAVVQTSGSGTLVNTAAGAAGALAGWAITSLGRSLAAADLQSTISSVATSDRTSSAPVSPAFVNGVSGPPPPVTLMLTSSSPGPVSSFGSTGKSMQLGATKVPASAITHDMAVGWTEEADAEVEAHNSNPWGNDDLMDVNADQDDWSAFESAPPAAVIGLHPTETFKEIDSDHWGDSLAEPKLGTLDLAPAASPPPPHRKSAVLSSAAANIRRPVPTRSAGRSEGGLSDPVHTKLSQAPTGITKEEKAAEIARRKEERKQRIAALKEQKKNAAVKS